MGSPTERLEDAYPFEHVFAEELEEIARSRVARQASFPADRNIPDAGALASDADPYERAHEAGLLGLSFSGGGIRSATFNLGIVQGLAKLGLLGRFDYVSSVSGGGYLSSWLAAWTRRRGERGIADVARGLRKDRASLEDVPREIGFLREYSNYLTPRTNALGADTWTLIAMYARNTSLNLIVLVAALLTVLMIPHTLFPLFSYRTPPIERLPVSLTLLFAVAFMTIGIVAMASNISDLFHTGTSTRRTWNVRVMVVLPLVLSAVFTASWLARYGAASEPWERWSWMLVAGSIYALLWLVGWAFGGMLFGDEAAFGRRAVVVAKQAGENALRLVQVLLSAFIAGAVAGLLLSLLGERFASWSPAALFVFAPPIVVLCFMASAVLHVGLAGSGFSEEVREWWSRLGASLSLLTVAIVVPVGVAIYGPTLLKAIAGTSLSWLRWLLASGWLLTTIVGLIGGKSESTGTGRDRGILPLVTSVAPYVFVVGLLLALSGLGTEVLDRLEQRGELLGLVNGWPLLCVVVFALLALTLSWRVGVNDFSMHALYRNRLVRCYLGASNEARDPHPFTGFDPRDDFPLADLASKPFAGPYMLFNTTLNLVAGEKLATQQRKAASFVFTPRFCGFETAATSGRRGGHLSDHGYRRTESYADSVSLGTVMAISGAAASPNMGYHSSSAVTFLMTLFNIRLGWWLGNPRNNRTWRRPGPWLGLPYLLSELLGQTNDSRGQVYLSDGGHFENLGVYELVRRRCRMIVACDAEQDAELKFGGLGNAIEKCRTDLGVDIELDVEPIRQRDAHGRSRWHCAVGKIRYDKLDRNAPVGTIVYIKSTLTGDETTDVLRYDLANPAFPHQSTGDQWFDETQFESYRALGQHVADSVFRRNGQSPATVAASDTERLFVRLSQHWHPPSKAEPGSFTRHTAELNRIMDVLRTSEALRFLDAQIYPEWEPLMQTQIDPPRPVHWLPSDPDQARAGFYICNRMIELMESVYHDLNLEDELNHPDHRGWMNLFKHWSWSSMFRVTWAICASTYGARFQTFCGRNLDLSLGQIHAEPHRSRRSAGGSLVSEAFDELNFVERGIVGRFAKAHPAAEPDVICFQLNVTDPRRVFALAELESDDPGGAERAGASGPDEDPNDSAHRGRVAHPFRFTFGFGIVLDGKLMYFRVQDHLRQLGLGRQTLERLFESYPQLGIDFRNLPSESPFGDPPSDWAARRFKEFFRSVSYSVRRS